MGLCETQIITPSDTLSYVLYGGKYGYIRVYMGVYMGAYGYVWVNIGIYGYIYGYIWGIWG